MISGSSSETGRTSIFRRGGGVSKPRARRETELRLKDTRENLLRVEASAGARQAARTPSGGRRKSQSAITRFRQSSARRRACWGSPRNEAASARAGRSRDRTPRGRARGRDREASRAETRLESLRDEHNRASDAMHSAQGALYESNAESRDSSSRSPTFATRASGSAPDRTSKPGAQADPSCRRAGQSRRVARAAGESETRLSSRKRARCRARQEPWPRVVSGEQQPPRRASAQSVANRAGAPRRADQDRSRLTRARAALAA